LEELDRENERLKKAVSELTLDKLILKEALHNGPEGMVTKPHTCNPLAYGPCGSGPSSQLADERSDEVTLFENLLPQARYVGEVGLDAGPRFYKSFAWVWGPTASRMAPLYRFRDMRRAICGDTRDGLLFEVQ
jgi:hypothetical protein